jgi:hypothetical protein
VIDTNFKEGLMKVNKRLLFNHASELARSFNEKHGDEQGAIDLMKEMIAQIEHIYPNFSELLYTELGNSLGKQL